MDDLLSEKEQIDQMRSWWSEYGAYVVSGIVLGAIIIFGVKYYQDKRLQEQQGASASYEELLVLVAAGNLDEAKPIADDIASTYASTSYVGPAGLAMARLYMDKNRDEDAAGALRAVIESGADDQLKSVARLRLGRLYLYQDKAQEAVDLLDGEDSTAFAAAYGEILGDAYTDLGRVADAQAAYQKVLLDPLAQNTIDRQLVQWKALDLPEVEIGGALESADTVQPVDIAEPKTDAAVEAEQLQTGDIE